MEKSELEIKKIKLDIEKTELEKLKLDRDLKNGPFTDKSRFWAETFRLLALTLITAGISFLFTSQTEDKKANYSIQLEEYKEYIKYKREFDNQSKNYTEKKAIACILIEDFSALNRPSVQRFLAKITSLCEDSTVFSKEKEVAERAEMIEQSVSKEFKDELTTTEKKVRQVREEIAVAPASNLSKLEAQQTIFTKKLDSLVNSNTQVNTLSRSSESVTSSFKAQSEIINNEIRKSPDKKSAAGYPRTEWFKEGYFLVFDDMKIILEKISNKETITVSICQSTEPVVCPGNFKLKENALLTTSKPLEIERGRITYIIRLEYIGSAGKNPFTRAAYITFEKNIN